MPPIRRSEITQRIAQLDEIERAGKGKTREYGQLRKWFSDHRFYLDPDDCARLNHLVASIDSQDQAIDPSNVRFYDREFIPFDGRRDRPYYDGA